jgi:hypothetical protein
MACSTCGRKAAIKKATKQQSYNSTKQQPVSNSTVSYNGKTFIKKTTYKPNGG